MPRPPTSPRAVPGVRCEDCRDPDPNVRHLHYLEGARHLSLAQMQEHLLDDLYDRYDHEPERARAYAEGILDWLRGQMSTYGQVLSADTGEILPWWDGRRQTIDAMHDDYERQRKEAELAQHEAQMRQEVAGFARGQMPDPIPMREPGEE